MSNYKILKKGTEIWSGNQTRFILVQDTIAKVITDDDEIPEPAYAGKHMMTHYNPMRSISSQWFPKNLNDPKSTAKIVILCIDASKPVEEIRRDFREVHVDPALWDEWVSLQRANSTSFDGEVVEACFKSTGQKWTTFDGKDTNNLRFEDVKQLLTGL